MWIKTKCIQDYYTEQHENEINPNKVKIKGVEPLNLIPKIELVPFEKYFVVSKCDRLSIVSK